MGKKTKKSYSAKLKFQIVLEALTSDKEDAEVARAYDVHPVSLSQWKRQYMSLTNTEFASIMQDKSKRIEGNIAWVGDEDHSPACIFRADVESEAGWPLFIQGRYNPLARTLTYALILKTAGRIYGLDLGKDHHNPQCDQVGEKHKHTWSENYRDKEAYVPNDITAQVSDPVAVWKQFCKEADIEHDGELNKPPPLQVEMFDEHEYL